jgi:hypothetical protein
VRYAVIALTLFFVACANASQTDETPSLEVLTPVGSISELKQQIYNIWLGTTREIVADDPTLACEPSTRKELADTVVSTDQDPIYFELAFLDACKEVGRIPYPSDFSPYYAEAP